MNPILAGQLRHVLTGVGGAVAGTGAVSDSMEAAIGGIALWGIGQIWSWIAKRGAGR